MDNNQVNGIPTPPTSNQFEYHKAVHRHAHRHGSLIIYLLVLVIAVFSVFSWQNSQLKNTKQALTAAQDSAKQQPFQASGIDSSKYQAIFLSNGQIYFGKLQVTGKQLSLSDIFYLQNSGNVQNESSTSAASSSSLVKLGCELHKPYDKMTINPDRVDFWENLQSDGQVATAITNFTQAHPNGQACSS